MNGVRFGRFSALFPFLLLAILLLSAAGCSRAVPEAPPAPTAAVAVQTPIIPGPTPLPAATPAPLPPAATATPPPAATPVPTATPVPSPTPIPTIPTIPTDVLREVREVELPEGFSLIKFADLQLPTSLAFDAQGRLFAASQLGSITLFADTTGDGRADQRTLFAEGFTIPTGIGHDPATGDLYVSSNTKITRLRDTDGDGSADQREEFVTGLPVGLHQNNNIAFGRDGMLYVGIGSTCDVCVEKDERSATVMRFDLATGAGEIFATGLRNPFDLVFHPEQEALFATDNGRDDLGWGVPQEELNLVREGGDYGWPDCWDDLQGSGCAGTQPAIAFFEARSSVNSVSFYTGDRFPQEWHGNLFVAVFGSWVNPNVPRGIWRVVLTEDGSGGFSAETEWFARWPLTSRLLGMAEGPDGALYVGDYQQGGIWRISYGLP